MDTNNANELAKTRICARLMHKDIKAANFIHDQYTEITKLREQLALRDLENMKLREALCKATRSLYGMQVPKYYSDLIDETFTPTHLQVWVGLSEEIIDDIGNTLSDEQGFIPVETWTDFANAISEKLRELNTKG